MPVASVAVLLVASFLVQTTTTEVRRIVGDPLPSWVVVVAGAGLLVVIVIAGLLVRRRSGHPE